MKPGRRGSNAFVFFVVIIHHLLIIVVVDETTTTNTKNTHFSIFVDDDIKMINKSEHIIALILVIGEVFETLLSYV